jgi:hypothetical protein
MGGRVGVVGDVFSSSLFCCASLGGAVGTALADRARSIVRLAFERLAAVARS